MGYRSAIVLASAIFLGATQAGFAADLPVKARPMAPAAIPIFSWSGCYIGGHAGYRWVHADAVFPSVAPGSALFEPELDYRLDSFVGGGQVGCNAQVYSRWVIGIEGDFSWGDASETREFDRVNLDQPVTLTADWNATLRGRLGWAFDRTLVYATGGIAWMRVDVENLDFDLGVLDPTSSFSAERTFIGWTVGGGIEHAFTPNWTARLEYLYAEYDRERFFNGITTATFFPTDVDLRTHTVRVGLNYLFRWR
jgi:outer membrane immunogenic protein